MWVATKRLGNFRKSGSLGIILETGYYAQTRNIRIFSTLLLSLLYAAHSKNSSVLHSIFPICPLLCSPTNPVIFTLAHCPASSLFRHSVSHLSDILEMQVRSPQNHQDFSVANGVKYKIHNMARIAPFMLTKIYPPRSISTLNLHLSPPCHDCIVP